MKPDVKISQSGNRWGYSVDLTGFKTKKQIGKVSCFRYSSAEEAEKEAEKFLNQNNLEGCYNKVIHGKN